MIHLRPFLGEVTRVDDLGTECALARMKELHFKTPVPAHWLIREVQDIVYRKYIENCAVIYMHGAEVVLDKSMKCVSVRGPHLNFIWSYTVA